MYYIRYHGYLSTINFSNRTRVEVKAMAKIDRLNNLNAKRDQYESEYKSILEQQAEFLALIGESTSRDKRIALRIQLADNLEDIANLRPLTVEEVVEMEELMEELRKEK